MTKEHRSERTDDIKSWVVAVSGQEVEIETGINGEKISVEDRLADPDHYNGPLKFDVFVNFKDIFVNLGMKNQHVSEQNRWSANNLPPRGITILEFTNPKVKGEVKKISEIAKNEFYDDEGLCKEYYLSNLKVYGEIMNNTGINPKKTSFLSFVRAGAVAGEMLGIPTEKQILIQTKRLPLKENDGNIAVGITYFHPEDIKRLNGKHWLIADPAGATFSSVIGNLIYLIGNGVESSRVSIWNTVASHKGSLFALNFMNDFGIKGEIVAGGYSPGMNNNYYLETDNKTPSVRDAGEGLCRYLKLKDWINSKN